MPGMWVALERLAKDAGIAIGTSPILSTPKVQTSNGNPGCQIRRNPSLSGTPLAEKVIMLVPIGNLRIT